MSRVEVLVACMNQTDDRLYDEMNLQTSAILANQGDSYFCTERCTAAGNTVRLFSTKDRGVGRNRNKALIYATGEYLLFADQDMIYEPGYEKMVLDAFQKQPDADMIAFNLRYRNRFTKGRAPGKRFKRIYWWNAMRYGAARIAIRRRAVEKHCLSFSVLYGGGAEFSSGEDSLFIREALRKGLRLYYSPQIIAEVKQEESSWFRGYTDKYFTDKGILIANAFPRLKHLLVFYFAWRWRKYSQAHSFFRIIKLMREGFSVYKGL